MPEPRRVPPTASLSLRFVVVGGSIAGLACAFSLQRAGHSVLVLEKGKGRPTARTSVKSPPNMTRILHQWGAGPALSKMSVKCKEYNFMKAETGEKVGEIIFHEKLMKALQANYMFIRYCDLHTLLFNMASKVGVQFKFGANVVGVDPRHATVFLEDGTKISGDLIIGADGRQSFVRSVVLGPTILPEIRDTWMVFSYSLSSKAVRAGEPQQPLTKDNECAVWLGDNCLVNAFLLHHKREYVVSVMLPAQGPPSTGSRDQKPILEDVKLNIHDFEPRVQKLIRLGGKVAPTKLHLREPFESWVHDGSKVLLCGDAAHPPIPNATHNAALALEDAAMLGSLFSHLQTRDQVPIILCAYEELRQPRCADIQKSELQRHGFLLRPNGPQRDVRDEGMRVAMKMGLMDWDDANEDTLREAWQEYVQVFAHDAHEAADDWWTKWGAVISRGRACLHERRCEVMVSSKQTVVC